MIGALRNWFEINEVLTTQLNAALRVKSFYEDAGYETARQENMWRTTQTKGLR